ncbi:MAG: type II toxin-antitoxin system HigB family toxin [Kordiimonadaceae bacterium]|nr:type II toxin-antitoxin system HigB family toxin [Kordiimonadaceae bacterium]
MWRVEVKAAIWANPTDVKNQFGSADPVGNNRMVFNICGNKYRLVVLFNYDVPGARVRFAGTHAEYDNIADIKTV